MNKVEFLEKYSKQDDKILISKIFDKIEACKRKNIITHTDFLDMYQKNIVDKILKTVNCNYMYCGGYEDSSRQMLLIYPDKIDMEIVKGKLDTFIEVIRIELPKNMIDQYVHKDYLSGIMKLGIKREKFGDIIVDKYGADIVVNSDISEFLYSNLPQLTRFSKSKITIEKLDNIKQIEVKKEDIRIVIQSLRLDNIVAELANTSRMKAQELIREGRVFINYEEQYKEDKQIKENDIVVIRGKGKFEIDKIEGITRKNKQILNVKKYI